MARKLDKLSIEGYKSIQALEEFELSNLNVLIGGNGAGKSNFIEIFRLLRAMVEQNLGKFALERGSADGFFFNGPKHTPEIKMHFTFGDNEYRFTLQTTADERFLIVEEQQKYIKGGWNTISESAFESRLNVVKDHEGWMTKRGVGYYVHDAISNWMVYHFHDTSSSAPMRKYEIVEDNKRLRTDASNIAPFLLELREYWPDEYQEIVDTVRIVTPFFDDFELEPRVFGEAEKVRLTWLQKGSDYPMQPYHLSDGSIRFICLATALLQPKLPSTIVIDEPELGLHPYAIEVLAELIRSASERTQVIISTQSPALVDYFSPEEVVVVNRKQGASTFERLNSEDLSQWLEDYSLGELWRKNVVIGAPSYE
ncbi:MAG: AAA family ATPase [Thiotrichales bacterium]|nr:AAA family ATPase [Thiotrichales bacterium]